MKRSKCGKTDPTIFYLIAGLAVDRFRRCAEVLYELVGIDWAVDWLRAGQLTLLLGLQVRIRSDHKCWPGSGELTRWRLTLRNGKGFPRVWMGLELGGKTVLPFLEIMVVISKPGLCFGWEKNLFVDLFRRRKLNCHFGFIWKYSKFLNDISMFHPFIIECYMGLCTSTFPDPTLVGINWVCCCCCCYIKGKGRI